MLLADVSFYTYFETGLADDSSEAYLKHRKAHNTCGNHSGHANVVREAIKQTCVLGLQKQVFEPCIKIYPELVLWV